VVSRLWLNAELDVTPTQLISITPVGTASCGTTCSETRYRHDDEGPALLTTVGLGLGLIVVDGAHVQNRITIEPVYQSYHLDLDRYREDLASQLSSRSSWGIRLGSAVTWAPLGLTLDGRVAGARVETAFHNTRVQFTGLVTARYTIPF
jgi:hypothetical protein